MPPIVKGNTGTLTCSWEVQGTVCCCLLVYGGQCVSGSLPRWPSSDVCLVRRFLTKGTVAAAAGALHSFVANA